MTFFRINEFNFLTIMSSVKQERSTPDPLPNANGYHSNGFSDPSRNALWPLRVPSRPLRTLFASLCVNPLDTPTHPNRHQVQYILTVLVWASPKPERVMYT